MNDFIDVPFRFKTREDLLLKYLNLKFDDHQLVHNGEFEAGDVVFASGNNAGIIVGDFRRTPGDRWAGVKLSQSFVRSQLYSSVFKG